MIEEKDEASFFDQEMAEVTEMMEAVEAVQGADITPEEKFFPINRQARRNAEKRNRALKKRKPHG